MATVEHLMFVQWGVGPNFNSQQVKSIVSTLLYTLAGTDLLCMLNWGTQWTMVSYLKK